MTLIRNGSQCTPMDGVVELLDVLITLRKCWEDEYGVAFRDKREQKIEEAEAKLRETGYALFCIGITEVEVTQE
ncbi:hypothetical protein [Streptomyces decoyicus]